MNANEKCKSDSKRSLLKTIAKTFASDDIGAKIPFAYDLLQEILNRVEKSSLPKDLKFKMETTRKNTLEFLSLCEQYVADFLPEYEALKKLQEASSKENKQENVHQYLFTARDGGNFCLLAQIEARTSDITKNIASTITVRSLSILYQNEI